MSTYILLKHELDETQKFYSTKVLLFTTEEKAKAAMSSVMTNIATQERNNVDKIYFNRGGSYFIDLHKNNDFYDYCNMPLGGYVISMAKIERDIVFENSKPKGALLQSAFSERWEEGEGGELVINYIDGVETHADLFDSFDESLTCLKEKVSEIIKGREKIKGCIMDFYFNSRGEAFLEGKQKNIFVNFPINKDDIDPDVDSTYFKRFCYDGIRP